MIPSPFAYVRATSVDHALELLTEHGDEAKLLAGGQSLLPLLKLRLGMPEVLIDISRLEDLAHIRVEGDEVFIGAGTRHCDIVDSVDLQAEVPILPYVTSLVGDRQIRHRGTFGGSLVHADPAADLPCAMVALGGTFVVQGPGGRREIAAEDFFVSYFQSAIEEDEILLEVRVPRVGDKGWAYEKFTQRSHDWAIVSVAVVDGRVALGNMSDTPVRASATESALAGGSSPAEAAQAAAEGTSPVEDMHADPDFRRHLAQVLTERALVTAAGR